MNVYDFDNTIYAGDSTIDFYFFCLRKFPRIIFRFPKQLWGCVCYKLRRITKEKFKEIFFSFLKDIPQIHSVVDEFWDRNQHKVKRWYRQQQDKDDLVISASPDFLLREICRRIKIEHLVATIMDEYTGDFLSKNCYGKEKVARFLEIYSNQEIAKFYSDSKADEPMALLAKEAYFVKGDNLYIWKGKRENEK